MNHSGEEKIIEPVLNENNEPMWLTIHTKLDSKLTDGDINTKEKMKQIIQRNKPLEEIKIFTLEMESQYICNKCGDITISNPVKPTYCESCKRDSSFKQMTETINQDLWVLPKWRDIPVENLDMQNTYLDMLNLNKRILIFPEEIHYELFTLGIISSWKSEAFLTTGFFMFLGMIDSGKTLCLDVIRELGYRMIHGASMTFPAIVRSSHYYHAGVLLDEIQDKLNPKTETGRDFISYLKPSYRRGSKYHVADKENPKKINSYNNYGYKAFAGELNFDGGIRTRSIVINMEKGRPEINKITEVNNELEKLRTILLNYRYKTTDPPELDETCTTLYGRKREIYEPIIRTAMHLGIKYDHIIEYITREEQEQLEDLQNTLEYEILKAIKELSEKETLDDAPETIKYEDIRKKVFSEEEYDSDTTRKNGQRMGYSITKKLNLKTKKMAHHQTVILYNHRQNQRRLEYLYSRYSV